MRALVLVGHGSLRKASGAAMIRLAALARKEGLAPIATAGFLNFSRPTFLDAVTRCADKGATEVIVQPYFLIPGYYVNKVLPGLLQKAAAAFPGLRFTISPPFGYHPALVEMVVDRALAVRSELAPGDKAALLLMAHGTPHPEANAALYDVAKAVQTRSNFTPVKVAFMELNEPGIAEAITELAAAGSQRIVAVPYFLQLGGHVAEDLPALIREARAEYPEVQLYLSDYLSYDARLLSVIETRMRETLEPPVLNVS